jgi:hypothetical protein
VEGQLAFLPGKMGAHEVYAWGAWSHLFAGGGGRGVLSLTSPPTWPPSPGDRVAATLV